MTAVMRLEKNVVLSLVSPGGGISLNSKKKKKSGASCKKTRVVLLIDWLQRDACCYPFRNHTWPNIVDTNTTANSVILSMHQVLP